VLLAQRRYAEAVDACREAIRLNFDEMHAHLDLWDALEALGRFRDLEAAARAVIERKSDHADAHARLGLALYAQARYAESVTAYRTAVERHPEIPRFRDGLAAALRKTQ
jgi:tetratricopeptide (TPR) repeat protein